MTMNSIAIVIPTAGRSSQLFDCLSSIAKHLPNGSQYEAIVVDNNSDPELSLKVKQTTTSFPNIRYSHCANPGLTSARHHALQVVNADILCFVDDDIKFSKSWFESTATAFQDEQVAIVGGPSIPDFQGCIPDWFWDFFTPTPYGGWCCPWLSLLDIGHDVDYIDPKWIWGLNFSIRRKVLLDCDGFHIDLVPKQYMRWQGDGETGLSIKLASKGYKAAYRQDSLVFHHCGADRLNSEYFAKRAYYQGVCDSFTEIREKLTGETSNLVKNNPKPIRRVIRRVINILKRCFRLRAKSLPLSSPWANAAADVHALCHHAQMEGYRFHQEEAYNDPDLRDWICRQHYFNIDLRDIRKSRSPSQPNQTQ